MNDSKINRLLSALEVSRDYLKSRDENKWVEKMEHAIRCIKKDDLSFVDNLYSKVAPTCEIENLFITEPEDQSPPISEEDANRINSEFAEIINELSNSLQPYWSN
jgi:hypothetical protein